jgi:hypothetical protein
MRIVSRLVLLASLVLALASCGGAQTGPARPTGDVHAPNRLYPLGLGYVWSYKIDTGTNLDSLVVMRVMRADDGHFEVSPGGGGTPSIYERRPEGLFRPGSGTWLLRAPITLGATWPSTSGMTATVTSVTARASTGAGDFENCVEVSEAGGEAGRLTRTVYCTDVGPVLIDTSLEMTVRETALHVIAKLQGFSFGGD